jgi:hypothetical protein
LLRRVYSVSTVARLCSPKMSIRSVHSRRTVPTQRSAIEFARGACDGVLITLTPVR